MATIASVRVPTEELALHESLATVPDLRFECKPLVLCEYAELSLLHAVVDDRWELETALDADVSVERWSLLTSFDGGWLYDFDWAPGVDAAFRTLTRGGSVTSATATDAVWHLRLVFSSREAFSEAFERCSRYGPSMEIEHVHTLADGNENVGDLTRSPYRIDDLTDEQREALRAACERGYFDVPRRISLSELADELDVSHQALSERLRRGHEVLVREVLFFDESGVA
ncbi:helix-turn-helix domain-containing protein [Halomarina halobia]|uniref:Helix-turn-helix domain-containing protein n=1 Tax=Halomarina halobia TaxID=3033386 RepID=A0ABD6A8Y7_9EURY|nr:helix-turn-helix domain-containing protein [Halomarina sp. PSR21]